MNSYKKVLLMSSETAIAQRDTSIPRKVSLRSELNREDSGYLSIIGTPAGTPSVMSVRRTSRADQPQTLKGIPENCLEQEVSWPVSFSMSRCVP